MNVGSVFLNYQTFHKFSQGLKSLKGDKSQGSFLRLSQNVFVFVFLLVKVLSLRHSDQMSQISEVFRIAL